MTVELIQGDCLKVMPGIEVDSVDLVFGSPPYVDARTYGIGFKLKGQDWVDWMVARVRESLRICKGLVAFIIEGKTKQFRWDATPALLMTDLHRAGIHLRKPPAFHRVGIPGSGGPDWLRNDYEFIVCCTNGGKLPWSDNTAMGHPPKYAPGGEMSHRVSDGSRVNQWGKAYDTGGTTVKDGQYIKGSPPRPSHKLRKGGMRRANGERRDHGYSLPSIANPGNVIKCNTGGGNMGSKLAHENEAPFPEALAQFFICSFCPPGGVVLDPFVGSGTTVAVASKEGRSGIGIDLRQSQIELSRKRIYDDAPLFNQELI